MERWNTEKQPKDGFTPFSSNVVTYQARALLPVGAYTVSQNTRDFRPGLKKRPGLERMDTYGYLGQTVDIRPGYDDGNIPGLTNVQGRSDEHASLAAAQLDLDYDLNTGEQNLNFNAPGVSADGYADGWEVGRISTTFNLLRYDYVTEVTAASLFIQLTDEVRLAAIATDFKLVLVQGNDPLQLCSSEDPDGDQVMDIGTTIIGTKILDPADLGGSGGEDYVIEIPLNEEGLLALNAILYASGGEGVINIVQQEGYIDYYDDELGLGGPLDNDQQRLEQRIDRYFPFLRISFAVADTPACIAMYQYNQMRSGGQETIAYFSNGDVVSSFIEPPTARGDVRPLVDVGQGDNSGYYPYSDGTPSDDKGDVESRALAPAYDSKWGKFIFRNGGLNNNRDWDHCPEDYVTVTDPPSFGVLDDVLIVADGLDYAKFYGGEDGQPCKASLVILVPGGAGPFPETGTFNDEWDNDGIRVDLPVEWTTSSRFYVYSPIQTDEFIIDVTSSSSGTGQLQVARWTGAAWTYISALNTIDTTETAGVTLKVDGTLTAIGLDSNKPQRLFGLTGYWHEFKTTGDIDATFDIKAKYKFQELTNVWDGVLVDAIESKVFDSSVGAAGTYYTYANTAIDVSLMTSTDIVYFSTFNLPKQIYIDVGATPNSGAVAPTLTFEYWNGAAWVTWTVLDDATGGLVSSGFVKLNFTNAGNSQKQPFQGSLWASYWWRMKTNQTLGDDMRISITYEPNFEMSDFGNVTECMAVWKERCVYTFDRYPSWLYVTQNGTFNVLNGDDYGVLQAGDGRRHSIKAMKKFHNELMVWQEEKGTEGGCLTLFEGYSPATFGKLQLSSKIGTLNANSAIVIDGALEASRSDYNAATIAYFISNYGIFMCDGQAVVSISGAIQNYFDPDNADCIRNGYQHKCWLAHDPTHQVLRMGIVSGASATEPNLFPVYDLITKRWSFDAFSTAHTPLCMVETSGGSSSAVQVAVIAGSYDGHIYLASSTNLNDGGDTAIDMQVRIELNDYGKLLELKELAIRLKRQTAGSCLFTCYENGVLNTDHSRTVDMTAGTEYVTGDENYVDRLILGVFQEDMISIAFRNNVIDQDMYLFDFWLDSNSVQNR